MQKAADQVRVNVQLVNAQTDSHLWAETYDRKLTDIFSVESEIAKGIAESLQAKLTGREEQAHRRQTDRAIQQAYDAYLRGLAYALKTADTPANLPWCTEISQRSGALGSEVRLELGRCCHTWMRSAIITLTLQPTVDLL